jgi:hypothetical protein
VLALAEKGFDITGVNISGGLIVARKSAASPAASNVSCWPSGAVPLDGVSPAAIERDGPRRCRHGQGDRERVAAQNHERSQPPDGQFAVRVGTDQFRGRSG